MKSSFCIDLQRFMLIPTKFPLSHLTSLKEQCVCHIQARGLSTNRRKPPLLRIYKFIYWNGVSRHDFSLKEYIEQMPP